MQELHSIGRSVDPFLQPQDARLIGKGDAGVPLFLAAHALLRLAMKARCSARNSVHTARGIAALARW